MIPAADLDLLQAYLDGQLGPAETLAFEARLKGEKPLAQALLSLVREEAILNRWACAATASDVPSMPGCQVQPRRRRFGPWLARIGLAAAVLAGVLLSAALWYRWPFSAKPVAAVQPAIHGLARLELLQGDVQIVKAAGPVYAAAGQELQHGDGIHTPAEDGFAILVYADGSRLELSPGTNLVLEENGGKRLLLTEGQLAADVTSQPDGKPMRVITPHAELTVLGTRFTAVTNSTGTRVDLEQGRLQFKRLSDGQVIDVQPGSYALALPRNELIPRLRSIVVSTPVRVLPSAPDKLASVQFTGAGRPAGDADRRWPGAALEPGHGCAATVRRRFEEHDGPGRVARWPLAGRRVARSYRQGLGPSHRCRTDRFVRVQGHQRSGVFTRSALPGRGRSGARQGGQRRGRARLEPCHQGGNLLPHRKHQATACRGDRSG